MSSTVAFISGALEHRQPRIFRIARIRLRKLAKDEDRSPIGSHTAQVPASGAQAGNRRLVSHAQSLPAWGKTGFSPRHSKAGEPAGR
jgi:hypothetical protein